MSCLNQNALYRVADILNGGDGVGGVKTLFQNERYRRRQLLRQLPVVSPYRRSSLEYRIRHFALIVRHYPAVPFPNIFYHPSTPSLLPFCLLRSANKVIRTAKFTIDARKPYVGYLVQLPQLLHHPLTY